MFTFARACCQATSTADKCVARQDGCSRMPVADATELMAPTLPQAFHEVFPHLKMAADVPKLVKTGDVDWDGVDAAFCCLPHATTQVAPCNWHTDCHRAQV